MSRTACLLSALVLSALARAGTGGDASALLQTSVDFSASEGQDFEIGSAVFSGGQRGTIVWDGRPTHSFVKLQWLEGKHKGKTSDIIAISDISSVGPAVESNATGRHGLKQASSNLHQKQKVVKVKDTTRRRRNIFRRVAYGIKKMPMVMGIPFRGLNTGVNTITSEMSAHTGIGFNRSITDLLKIGEGSLMENATFLPAGAHRKKTNLTAIMRNKTYQAVMKFKEEHLNNLLNSFTSELHTKPLSSVGASSMLQTEEQSEQEEAAAAELEEEDPEEVPLDIGELED
mmetsp:Transcript_44727/g.138326  ORF Transcript_44727/g.138326 Transcript_44727/m.138326 type:complete len:287 (-) Transcript_44727:61-921(-)